MNLLNLSSKPITTMKHVSIGWFEIPVENMERAMVFYETVFDCKLDRHKMGPLDMA
jgi:predicted enzyme related to lactoylglutathione lyase